MGKKKNGDTGKKKEDTTIAVFKIEMHCEGCANKIRKTVREIQGVKKVRADWEANKLTVIGEFDPSKLAEKLADMTKKKADIVSSAIKKDDSKKADDPSTNKPDKKPDEKKPKDKEIPVTTATLKVELHCQGCIERIYRVVSKTKGVEDMSIDRQKDLVTVKGRMDVKALVETLEEKLKRQVGVVAPKKDKDGGGAKSGDGGEKNKGGGDGGQGESGGGGGITEGNRLDYVAVPVPGYGYGYGPGGYVGEYLPSPQIFSDENPNACSVM